MKLRRSRAVDVTQQRVVKFLPKSPPRRGDFVLVDGERCRVTYARVSWTDSTWTIKTLRVKPAPFAPWQEAAMRTSRVGRAEQGGEDA